MSSALGRTALSLPPGQPWDYSVPRGSWRGSSASLVGGKCQAPTSPAPVPVGKPRQERFLCRLCADSSTDAPLNTFPFQPSPAPPFQADQPWIFAGVCDGSNARLRAYCSHAASAPPHLASLTSCKPNPQIHQRSPILFETLPETSHQSLQGL